MLAEYMWSTARAAFGAKITGALRVISLSGPPKLLQYSLDKTGLFCLRTGHRESTVGSDGKMIQQRISWASTSAPSR
jgi:hypothetical protein